MLQTMAQMGFKHLPGEGRVFAQDLFYPSSYTSMGDLRGPSVVLSGQRQVFSLHEDASLGDAPAACLPRGKPSDAAVCCAFFSAIPACSPPCSFWQHCRDSIKLNGVGWWRRAQDQLCSPGRPSCVFPVLPPAGCHTQYWVRPAWPLLILWGSSLG